MYSSSSLIIVSYFPRDIAPLNIWERDLSLVLLIDPLIAKTGYTLHTECSYTLHSFVVLVTWITGDMGFLECNRKRILTRTHTHKKTKMCFSRLHLAQVPKCRLCPATPRAVIAVACSTPVPWKIHHLCRKRWVRGRFIRQSAKFWSELPCIPVVFFFFYSSLLDNAVFC